MANNIIIAVMILITATNTGNSVTDRNPSQNNETLLISIYAARDDGDLVFHPLFARPKSPEEVGGGARAVQ